MTLYIYSAISHVGVFVGEASSGDEEDGKVIVVITYIQKERNRELI